jgi:type II secretory pathway pseudopilin PulG
MTKQCQGQTLLEMLLLIVIVALIISFSIKYYRSVQQANLINDLLSRLYVISETMDQLALKNSGNGYTSITQSNLTDTIGTNAVQLMSSTITISNTTSTAYTVTISSIPDIVGTLVFARLGGSVTRDTTYSGLRYTYTLLP